jgi:hypothetical protein
MCAHAARNCGAGADGTRPDGVRSIPKSYMPADGISAADGRNGDFDTSLFFWQL